MRFLVVDDDFTTRQLVQRLLHPYGNVDVATDGEEAVHAFINALNDKDPYSLITLDILMPHSNGQQALREIREIEKERGILPQDQVRIVMISGLDDCKELHDAFFLGDATSYLVKPINHKLLLDELGKLGLPVPLQKKSPS